MANISFDEYLDSFNSLGWYIGHFKDEYDEEGRPLKIENERDILRYSESKFIAFIAGALQEEIKRRKELEIIVNNLINKGEFTQSKEIKKSVNPFIF